MKKWLNKFRQIMLYGGLEKEQYRMISKDIDEANRKSVVVLSTACMLIYLLRMNIFNTNIPTINRILFLTAILVSGGIALVNSRVKGNGRLIHFSAYLFMAVYIGVGIISSVGEGSIHERTTLYLVFIVSAPMMFALNAIEIALVIIPAEVIYLAAITYFQSAYPVYATNRSNSIFFCIAGMVLGIYMANMRISGICSAYMNLRMEEIKQLNKQISKSKEELQIALAAAEHANRSKTVFLNNMSHDIRTPMNAIIGFTSLAATHIDDKKQVQNYLEKVMTSSQHLLSLINDVLDMSRIESGKVKIEEKPVHLPEVLHDIRTIIQSGVASKQLDLFIDTQDVLDENIVADKLRLNQILINLLSNAIKFTKSGGTIAVRVIQKPGAPEGYADYEFHVKDNGIGMSKEFQSHIFEAFSREDSSIVSDIQGTGLGMAITKNIVDMMNGTISVDSEPGKGTEFIVSLRFALSGQKVKEVKIARLEGLRALVADDDTDACRSMSRMLRQIGMRSEWTASGKEAVIRAEDALEQGDEFSVYIIDWLMPDMNGIETVRRIRRIVGSDRPIIILTAYDWTDIEKEAREAGVTAFVSKPIFMSELREILSRPFYQDNEEADHKEVRMKKNDKEIEFIGKKVLLVEDNELNQEIAQEILSEAGFKVEIAADGIEAVEKVEQSVSGQYDVILMDVQMPRMNGYEATKHIRDMEDRSKANIPIVAMTANAFEEDKKAALAAGMNAHIAKPIEVDKLKTVLQQIFLGLQRGK